VLSSYQNILLLLTGVLASLSQSRSTYWQIACISLFAWLISHQPTIFFSQNKPATSNQPAVLFSQNKPASAISHQPNEQAASIHDYLVSIYHFLPQL
jgi:hypothetical protein